MWLGCLYLKKTSLLGVDASRRGVAWPSSFPHLLLSNLVPFSILGSLLSCLTPFVLASICATGSLLTGACLFPAGGLMLWLRVLSVRCPVSCRVKNPLPWPVRACTFITPPCASWVTNLLGYLNGGLRSTWGRFQGFKRVSFSFAPSGLAASQLNASLHL